MLKLQGTQQGKQLDIWLEHTNNIKEKLQEFAFISFLL
jgi:hypothetical protein